MSNLYHELVTSYHTIRRGRGGRLLPWGFLFDCLLGSLVLGGEAGEYGLHRLELGGVSFVLDPGQEFAHFAGVLLLHHAAQGLALALRRRHPSPAPPSLFFPR